MDSKRNVVNGTPFEAFLGGEDFAAITKDDAVLHALLQFFPDWVFQVGLRGNL